MGISVRANQGKSHVDRRAVLALVAGVLFGVCPQASVRSSGTQWTKLYVAADRSVEVAIDLAGLRLRGNVVLAWLRFSYRTDQRDSGNHLYRSMVQRWAYECEPGRQALVQFAEFSGEAGSARTAVASGFRGAYHWSYPEPDTVGEAVMKLACAHVT